MLAVHFSPVWVLSNLGEGKTRKVSEVSLNSQESSKALKSMFHLVSLFSKGTVLAPTDSGTVSYNTDNFDENGGQLEKGYTA